MILLKLLSKAIQMAKGMPSFVELLKMRNKKHEDPIDDGLDDPFEDPAAPPEQEPEGPPQDESAEEDMSGQNPETGTPIYGPNGEFLGYEPVTPEEPDNSGDPDPSEEDTQPDPSARMSPTTETTCRR
ncbi:hypothetical protein [Pararhodobacter sp. SW119]|uniref:hypothetical protein n=1 Tax=Pararhodobacter sp. SW119 TaxID=2780075 RepID=UPI001AE00B7A|nr:hypothetical protein [Pararhodobacter sp. SW119]